MQGQMEMEWHAQKVVSTPHLGGRNVALNFPESIRGSKMAYGPLGASSRSRNCVSGGRSAAVCPYSGDIQYILILADARNLHAPQAH